MRSIVRYFVPRNYGRKIRQLWYLWRYNINAIASEEEAKFSSAGLNREKAVSDLNEHLMVLGLPRFNECDGMASVHWLLFACVKNHHLVRRILEIGTFDGQTTALLARMFPAAEILTIDLPASDPLLRATYGRGDGSVFEEFEQRQARNTSAPNVTLLKINSFFLPHAVEGPFDLTWVDGGHLYPEIAWDLCNAYHLTRPGGVIMCDDVIEHPHGLRDTQVSPDSHTVLRYITERTAEQLFVFLKRQSAEWSADPRRRKFVALLRKGERRQVS